MVVDLTFIAAIFSQCLLYLVCAGMIYSINGSVLNALLIPSLFFFASCISFFPLLAIAVSYLVNSSKTKSIYIQYEDGGIEKLSFIKDGKEYIYEAADIVELLLVISGAPDNSIAHTPFGHSVIYFSDGKKFSFSFYDFPREVVEAISFPGKLIEEQYLPFYFSDQEYYSLERVVGTYRVKRKPIKWISSRMQYHVYLSVLVCILFVFIMSTISMKDSELFSVIFYALLALFFLILPILAISANYIWSRTGVIRVRHTEKTIFYESHAASVIQRIDLADVKSAELHEPNLHDNAWRILLIPWSNFGYTRLRMNDGSAINISFYTLPKERAEKLFEIAERHTRFFPWLPKGAF